MRETKRDPASRLPRRTGFGWRRLQAVGAIGILVPPAAFAAITGEFDLLLVGWDLVEALAQLPVLIGLILLLFPGRIGVVWLGVISLLLLALNVPLNRLYPPGGGEQPVVQASDTPRRPLTS